VVGWEALHGMKVALIPVRLASGLVVMHTAEQYERLMRGVDVPAAAAMTKPIGGTR
jgi:hypothetical protein